MENSMTIYDGYFVIDVTYNGRRYVDTIEYIDLHQKLISIYQTESISFLTKIRLLTALISHSKHYNVIDNLVVCVDDNAIVFAINGFSFEHVHQLKIKDTAFIAVTQYNNTQTIENVILCRSSLDPALFLTNALVKNTLLMEEPSIFHECTSLTMICIDESCKCRCVYDDYFGACYLLKTVILKSPDLCRIMSDAFVKCHSLTDIYIDVDHVVDIELNQIVIDNKCKIHVPPQLMSKYITHFHLTHKLQYIDLVRST